jgi:AraC-like DNA-binding protein
MSAGSKVGSETSDIDFQPTLSGRFVVYVRDYLLDRQITPGPIFEACGVNWESNARDVPLPVHKIAYLLELAAQASNNSAMGIHMAQNYHYEAGSILITAMLSAPTVEQGLRCLQRYDRYVDTGISISLDFSESVAQFESRILCDEDVSLDQLNEYLMVFTVRTVYLSTRQSMPLKEVWLAHENKRNRVLLESIFGVPVKYAQVSNALRFDRSYLKTNQLSSDPLVFEVLTNAMKTYYQQGRANNTLVDRVVREILNSDDGEAQSAERIAERLAVSPRTLRRRLSDEGYSFNAARNLARERRARYLLTYTTMPLTEIALKLGYSELSSFIRAFRSWTNFTPQNYRDENQDLGDF